MADRVAAALLPLFRCVIAIPLAQLLERGVRLEPAEAVAIVQALAEAPGEPRADNVEIDSGGGVRCRAAGGRPSVRALAALLDRLMPAAGIPAALRYTIARGIGAVEAPPFPSIVEFSQALTRFEASDRGDVIRALISRARPAPSVRPAPQPPAPAVDPADLPIVAESGEWLDLPLYDLSEIQVPPAPRHPFIFTLLIVFLLTLSAIAGYVAALFVMSYQRDASQAPRAAPAPAPMMPPVHAAVCPSPGAFAAYRTRDVT
jgi:hypothetical protein